MEGFDNDIFKTPEQGNGVNYHDEGVKALGAITGVVKEVAITGLGFGVVAGKSLFNMGRNIVGAGLAGASDALSKASEKVGHVNLDDYDDDDFDYDDYDEDGDEYDDTDLEDDDDLDVEFSGGVSKDVIEEDEYDDGEFDNEKKNSREDQ